MLQIRANIFETNSSSTHTLNISKKTVEEYPGHIDFHFGEYGWECGRANFANYLYTAIYDCCNESDRLDVREREKRLEKIRNFLDKHGVTYSFEKPKYSGDDGWRYFSSGYVDHADLLDTYGILDTILDDEDMLARALFRPESVIWTGNDNYGWDEAQQEDEDKFDVFYKGN